MTIQPFIVASLVLAAAVSSIAGDASVIEKTPGLVAFWTFGEEAGQQRGSQGTKEKHPLAEVSGPIARVEGRTSPVTAPS